MPHDDKSSNRGGSLRIILFTRPPQLQYFMHLQAQIDSDCFVRAGFLKRQMYESRDNTDRQLISMLIHYANTRMLQAF